MRLNHRNVRIALVVTTILSVLAVVVFGLSRQPGAPGIFGLWRLAARLSGLAWLVLAVATATLGRTRGYRVLAFVSGAAGLILLFSSALIT
jgi:hypothetical protein